MKRSLLVVLMVASMAWLSACNTQKAPEQELSAAKAAMDAAAAANIDPANADFKKAKETLSAAAAELNAQDKKWSLTRDYKKAQSMLAEVKTLADKALGDHKAAMEAKAKAEAEAKAKAEAEAKAKAEAAKKKGGKKK
jgi:colicin import membrane protein